MIPPLSSRMRLVANLPYALTGPRRARLHFLKRQQAAALVPGIPRKEMLLPAIVPLNGSGVEMNFYPSGGSYENGSKFRPRGTI
jgi:hypothetical protein